MVTPCGVTVRRADELPRALARLLHDHRDRPDGRRRRRAVPADRRQRDGQGRRRHRSRDAGRLLRSTTPPRPGRGRPSGAWRRDRALRGRARGRRPRGRGPGCAAWRRGRASSAWRSRPARQRARPSRRAARRHRRGGRRRWSTRGRRLGTLEPLGHRRPQLRATGLRELTGLQVGVSRGADACWPTPAPAPGWCRSEAATSSIAGRGVPRPGGAPARGVGPPVVVSVYDPTRRADRLAGQQPHPDRRDPARLPAAGARLLGVRGPRAPGPDRELPRGGAAPGQGRLQAAGAHPRRRRVRAPGSRVQQHVRAARGQDRGARHASAASWRRRSGASARRSPPGSTRRGSWS